MGNYAFISYSHEDLKAVRKLHKRIEGFKIPGFVRKSLKDAPKRLYPIFRDETDLAGHGLTASIRIELANSSYLIVVCTESSAASPWVEKEIDVFLESHSIGEIIPVFLDKKTRDAFSGIFPGHLYKLSLCPNEPLLYSFGTRHRCLFEIATHLLDCHSYELTYRYVSKRTDRMLLLFFLGLLFLFIIYTDLQWAYKDQNDIIEYYRDVSFEYGWPHGVDKLDPAFVSQEDDYYICTFRNNRIVALEHVYPEDSAANFPGHYLLEADRMAFAYNNNWGPDGYATARISKIIFKNREGNILFVKNNSLTLDVADLTVSAECSDPFYLPEDMTSTCLGSQTHSDESQIAGSCRIGQSFDEAGRIKQIWFLTDTFSYMIPDRNGYYALEFVYDEAGSVNAVRYLDADGGLLDVYIPQN